MIRQLAWLALTLPILHAQQAFEAASVRPSKQAVPWSYSGGPGTNDPAQITYKNVTLADIILRAYDILPYQLNGAPSWLDSKRYTIIAKVRPGASKAEAREMMRTLLAERFKLAVHRETQEGRRYSLVVEKGGPRLKAGTGGESAERATIVADGNGLTVADSALGRPVALAGKHLTTMVSGSIVTILGNSQPISALAGALSGMLDGPVSDTTKLNGVYDFSLFFEPPLGVRGPQPGPPGEMFPGFTPAGEALPSVFEALKEKLGLRLDIIRGPVEVLIIDHADRVPAGN